jgi:thiol-disulfide isomerase/thioredoxin
MPTLHNPRRRLALAILFVAAILPACSRMAPPKAVASAPVPTPVTVDDIRRMTKDSPARVVFVNVWATWCGPCRDELPALVKLQHRLGKDGLDLILVSADFDVSPDKLATFLTSQGVDFQTYLKTEKDAEFKKAMSPDWSGAIPATFVYSDDGELFDFWEGAATYETFEAKAKEAMEQTASPAPAGG